MYLMIGLNCVDIVNYLSKYPLEDSDQRCNRQSWERGGNASNNASVLAELGAQVEFFGTLAKDHLLNFFIEDMDSRGILNNHCPILDCYQSPASVVISSEETGSRTIIHNNGGLPELTFEQFHKNISLEDYSWIHFEGRNEDQLPQMLQKIKDYNNKKSSQQNIENTVDSCVTNYPNYKTKILPVSVEVEKTRECLGALLQFADVVFIGKDYATMKGAQDPTHAARIFSNELQKGVLIICPWGEEGATYCVSGESPEKIKKVNAFPPEKIVDSLGAGDTFCSAVIFALNKKLDPETSVQFGCQVAGKKLGIFGYRNIFEAIKTIPECHQVLSK